MKFFKKKKYLIKVKCDNCSKLIEVKIPRGVSVGDALNSNVVDCDYCGCEIQVQEYETEWSVKK